MEFQIVNFEEPKMKSSNQAVKISSSYSFKGISNRIYSLVRIEESLLVKAIQRSWNRCMNLKHQLVRSGHKSSHLPLIKKLATQGPLRDTLGKRLVYDRVSEGSADGVCKLKKEIAFSPAPEKRDEVCLFFLRKIALLALELGIRGIRFFPWPSSQAHLLREVIGPNGMWDLSSIEGSLPAEKLEEIRAIQLPEMSTTADSNYWGFSCSPSTAV
ncbi:hypothetical protein COLO4_04438 [Corchorus olitorius]|uniref:Uncharacterized protein n=1 Tax=Corchorus olitorius TaxID=93759 RepID=A0A1R3KU33_9ROSI|nr:hypothetical protein COLO4_04438 [Corchorus olitorius]